MALEHEAFTERTIGAAIECIAASGWAFSNRFTKRI